MPSSATAPATCSDKVREALARQPNVSIVYVDEAYTSARCCFCYTYTSRNEYVPMHTPVRSRWTGKAVYPKEHGRSWCATCQRMHSRDLGAAASIAKRGMLRVTGERDMLMDASRRGEAYEAHVLKAFLASLDEVARGRLPVRLPAAAAEFDPAWSLGDLRNVVRLHAMHRAKARAQRRRAQVQQPPPQGGGGVAQPQLQQQQGAVGIDVPLRHVAPAS